MFEPGARTVRLGLLALPIALFVGPIGGWACAAGESETRAEGADAESAASSDDVASALSVASFGELVNPNEAASAELVALEGLTAEAVAALEGGRPFASMTDVHVVLSAAIGDEAARAAYEHLWLPIGLNDATREEILLIPGVGARMAHEFEEYRPYADTEQFRREIGKYVDGEEVDRLERYVTLH